MMTASITQLTLALVVATSASPNAKPPTPAYLHPPAGWTSLGPPPPNTVDYGWVSPHFRDGSPHAGDSMEVWVKAISPNSTLTEQIREATTDETTDGRTVASSRSHPTCNGTQPGWTIDFRLALSPFMAISQVEHIAVFEGHVYVINFTHRADLPVDSAVQASIDSLCPKNGR
jgi:hypothetical protein